MSRQRQLPALNEQTCARIHAAWPHTLPLCSRRSRRSTAVYTQVC